MFAAKDTLLTRPSGGAYQISRSVRFVQVQVLILIEHHH
jgi:hypothetical protein